MISGQIENGILHLHKKDSRLSRIISLSGPCSLKRGRYHLYALFRAIIYQQLSGKAAESIISRFFGYYGGKPDPSGILSTPDSILKNLGLSNQKIKYIKDLSKRVLSKEISFRKLSALSDDEIIDRLTAVKGIGVWTAQMFLIFTLNRLNVLPVNDLGIKKGVMKVYNLKKLPDEKKIISIARRNHWSPYCSIASWYLWKSLEL